MKSNERVYYISTLNRDVAKDRMRKHLDTYGVLTAKDVNWIVSSTGGIYDPQVEELEEYGWTSLSGAFNGKTGGRYFLQLPMIQKLLDNKSH